MKLFLKSTVVDSKNFQLTVQYAGDLNLMQIQIYKPPLTCQV